MKSNKVEPSLRNILLFLPDLFVLLLRLVGDAKVDLFHKLEFVIAITYVLNPVDVLPDFIPPLGYLDDLIVVLLVLTRLISMTGKVGEDIVKEYWAGDDDVLDILRRLSIQANETLSQIGILTILFERFRTLSKK